ncbi:MAG: hypothetical protein GX029_07780 [Pseudomonadaceae bacterium]|nr:hypothetical protein [Pseudomonadaceae bacterium]
MGSVKNSKEYLNYAPLKINGLMTVKSNIKNMGNNAPIEEQANLTLENLSNLLQSSGSCLNNLLSTTVYLCDMKELDAFEKVWQEWFKDKKEPKRFIVESPNEIQNLKLEIISTAAF